MGLFVYGQWLETSLPLTSTATIRHSVINFFLILSYKKKKKNTSMAHNIPEEAG